MRLVGRIDDKVVGIVHIPILARWVEGMMRIGKRHKQEKRLFGIRAVPKPIGRLIANVTRMVQIGRDGRAIGLIALIVMRQLIGAVR